MSSNPTKQCQAPLARLTLPKDLPADRTRILLHSCCAPCSGAIIECMISNGIRPTIFFSNSNIVPFEEYQLRKTEVERYARKFGLEVVDDDYSHDKWLDFVLERTSSECISSDLVESGTSMPEACCSERSRALAAMPERQDRCLNCFKFRLLRAARYAAANGFNVLTTTLASSRWKDLTQVDEAGRWACGAVSSHMEKCGTFSEDVTPHSIKYGQHRSVVTGDNSAEGSGVIWWGQNWRKGGLQPRRSEIIKEEGFYNQNWCGCEFSKKVLEI